MYEGQVDAVTLPGTDGELGVLATHIPLISSLKRGRISIHQKKAGNPEFIDIKGGFVEIQPESKVIVLAN